MSDCINKYFATYFYLNYDQSQLMSELMVVDSCLDVHVSFHADACVDAIMIL